MSESRQRLDGTTPSTDLVEERELRAVSLLLRGLPDPEPPSQLVDRVIAEVARREARPRVIRIFGRLPGPAVGTALAAGVSCLVLFGAIQGGLLVGGETPPAPREVAARLVPTKARLVSTGTDASAARLRRPIVPRTGRPKPRRRRHMSSHIRQESATTRAPARQRDLESEGSRVRSPTR